MGRQDVEMFHHDQVGSVQNAFRKVVCSLVNVMDDLGNPFEEESEDLLFFDSKEIADPSAVEADKKPITNPNLHKGMFRGENKSH